MSTFTPGQMRAAVLAALADGLGADAQQSVRPVTPSKAPRSRHDLSYAVVMTTTLDTGVEQRGGDGDRIVMYAINVELTRRVKNANAMEDALSDLYEFADDAYKALMSQIGEGGSFACIPFEFVTMGPPEQGDAEYRLTLEFAARAYWPSTLT